MMMRIFFTFLLVLLISNNASAFSGSRSVVVNSNEHATFFEEKPDKNIYLLAKLPLPQVEKYLGRKLKFKEKLAFKILKLKFSNKSDDEPKSKKGKTSLTLGILALVTLFIFPLATIPLGILAITNGNEAIKTNPNDRDGKTGKTMGIISLAVLAFTLLALVALIKAFAVY